MQDTIGIGIPLCFSSGDGSDDPAAAVVVTRSGQSIFMSVYRTKVADTCRLITITWCKNLLLHGLSVSVQGPEGESQYTCKVELKPWNFWRKQGSKRMLVEGNNTLDIFWDLKGAKFNGETEPSSEYYVAVVCREEVVLLIGDLKNDAYRKTGCRPALIDPILVLRREHIFGKRRFCTRAKFHEKGRYHEISIECKNKNCGEGGGGGVEPEMEIRIDGHLVLHVKHLQWKFRGNGSIHLNKVKIQVYWDVHDWLFCPGLRHALFIFKPSVHLSSLLTTSSSPLSSSSTSTCTPLSSQTGSCGSLDALKPNASGSSEFSLFLYAWKVE